MFSTSIGRVARTTCTASAQQGLIARCPTTAVAAPAHLTAVSRRQPQHQRRHSSSKASVPPDNSKRSPVRDATTPATARVGRRKTKEPVVQLDGTSQSFSKQYPNLPSVPSTQHLHPSDIDVSSFFSCHRPISVTSAVPIISTEKSFGSIFDAPVKNPHGDVIFTLNTFVENLEGQSANDGNLFGTVSEDGGSSLTHIDGTPMASLDRLVERCRPFRPPPPPQPFDEFAEDKLTTVAKPTKSKAKVAAPRQKRKSWSTTIIVTEYTGQNGEKTYQAASTPIVRVPSPKQKTPKILAEAAQTQSQKPMISQPFLRRMFARRQLLEQFRASKRQERAISDAREGEKGRAEGFVEPGLQQDADRSIPAGQQKTMMLISVKRQRKLKMKKHKYKKLMKRTRNLRRRLGKI